MLKVMNRECTYFIVLQFIYYFDPSRGNIVYYVFMWLIYWMRDNMFHTENL